MLRLSVRDEEFLMIGDDVKIVFLGSSGGQTRIMIDAPKDVNIVRKTDPGSGASGDDPEVLQESGRHRQEEKIQRRDRTE